MRNLHTFPILLFLLTYPAAAQSVTVGLKTGWAITNEYSTAFRSDLTDESKHTMLGPMVEIGIWRRLSLEIDVLHRSLGFNSRTGVGGFLSTREERLGAWEVPILTKYRHPLRLARPRLTAFVSGGLAPRALSGSATGSNTTPPFHVGDPTVVTPFQESVSYHQTGAVIGAGIEFGLGPLRIAPEYRYTHWNHRTLDVSFSSFHFGSVQNQSEFLIGIGWRFGRDF